MNRKMKKILCVVILTVFASTAAAVFAADPETKDPEKVLARVEGQEIKEKDVDQFMIAAGPQVAMMYDNEQGRKIILDELDAGRLLAISGKKQRLDDTPEFKEALENFTANFLIRATIEEIVKDVTASDEDCKKFYDENLNEFATPDEIRASHILLPDDEARAAKIALIQGELEKGVSLDVFAAEHSINPSAQQNGGDLGFFSRGQMVPEFEEAAFALKEPGDISDPVKSDFGWHIIKLEEKKPSGVMPYDDVKLQLEQYLSNEKKTQKYQDELEALRKEYKIEILD